MHYIIAINTAEMYDLPYHKEADQEVIIEFMRQYPFAFVSGCDKNSKPVATQLPLLVEVRGDKIVLCGHLMKNMDHHKAFLENPNVLAVFTGPHTYVSGTWYSNPNTASTWNYMSVHASGQMQVVDESRLAEIMQQTSLHFEKGNPASPTVFEHLPDSFKEKALKMIIGFELPIQELRTVFKLSQDRDEESYQNIIEKLNGQGGDSAAIAAQMSKRKGELFK